MSRFSFILTAFQNIIQVNKIFAKVNISIELHFIKIVAALTVFVTVNSTQSHIYRDICSGSTHCYKHYTVILSRPSVLGFMVLHVLFQHSACKYTSRCLFLCPFAFCRKPLTVWLSADSSGVESSELCKF